MLFRSWAQMCKARLADDAQRETQEFARKVQDVVAPLYPVSWDNLMRMVGIRNMVSSSSGLGSTVLIRSTRVRLSY